MPNNHPKINLLDLIDIDFLQKLQDTFAKAMGVASLTVDDKGPITSPSNFSNFCKNHIRKSKLGSQRCNECDIQSGKLASIKGEPIIHNCHTGLAHFAVPIIVKGQHIASILGGQIVLGKPDIEHFKQVAKELGIKDEKKYFEDLDKIKIFEKEHIEAATKLLSLVANSISEIAHKNYELNEKNERERLVTKIIEKLRSTLEEEEIKKYFIETVGNYFNTDRCLFVDYDLVKEKFLPFKLERLKSPKMKSIVGLDTEEAFPEFCEKLKRKKRNVIIKDLDKTLARKSLLGYKALESLRQSDAKSDYGLIVWYKDQIIGILILHFLDKKRVLTHDELDFLKTLRDHAGTAIYQAKLYKNQKNTAERENILRNIIEKIRNSLDIKVIQNEIVNQIGKFFNASGVRIAEYDYNLEDYVVTSESEYRKSNEIKSMIGIKFKDIQGFNEFITNIHLKGKNIIFSDLEVYLDDIKIRGTGVENFYREFGFISSAAINIYYGDHYIGDFVLTFNKIREFSEDEINFLKALADQAGVGFYQAKLHQKTLKQAEREKLLRKITETIRQTLDINETKKTIVTEICKSLNADRVFIVEFDTETNKPQVLDEYSEYKVPGLESLIGYDFASSQVEFLANIHKQNKPVIVQDIEKFIIDNNLQNTEVEKWLREMEVKSGIGMSMVYGNRNFGVLSIHYTKSVYPITKEYIDFFASIVDEAGIALYQAQLHTTTKRQAERERVLREVTNKIRSSLDFEEIKHEIVTQLGMLFDADRVVVAYYDYEANNYVITKDSEYKSSEDVKTFVGADFVGISGFAENIRNSHFKGHDIIFNDLEEYLDKNNLRNTGAEIFYRDFGFISSAAINIYHEKAFLGNLVITYQKPRILKEEEIRFLRSIADQVGVAFYQAELYKKTKQNAKREALLRKITSTIRTSLDLEETFNIICSGIAKITGANRVSISELIEKYNKYLIKGEFKTSEDIKSIRDMKIDKSRIFEYLTTYVFTKNESLIIDNIEEADIPDFVKEFYKSLNVKSITIFPIKKGKDEWGILTISYIYEYKTWNESEISLLETILEQIYIAIKQAELYENEKIMLERERISRNIIEILRSSIDKKIIKKLFVKNIGKFFGADRVFFSEYNVKNKSYLPVDKDSEYLSNIGEKSFIGYDWSKPEIRNYIQPLLEKREIKIANWEEYIQNHPEMNEAFRTLYEDLDIKSSYNFPVLYQDEIIGHFCLEFTQQVCKLSEEDFEKIRSICTQAGIALYHSELYLKAQECAISKESFVNEFFEKIKTPTNKILDTSMLMYHNEFERSVQLEYLNSIISSCNQLLELTK
ncbi:MAG: PocR ligand-binding domain-containing protein [Candidatus Gastranaerophilales bacterium]|nr:PocR ligand-binding domain-containing protein [Candidatus Gastranaerophilales bacterium]